MKTIRLFSLPHYVHARVLLHAFEETEILRYVQFFNISPYCYCMPGWHPKAMLHTPLTNAKYCWWIHYTLALTIRLVLAAAPYEDADYGVYVDAARYALHGQSVYERHTYRYTPLLAWMLCIAVPDPWRFVGKWIFALFDIGLIAIAHSLIVRFQEHRQHATDSGILIALYSPLHINIVTRGSADSIVIALCMGTLACLSRRKSIAAGLCYGAAVHVKLYPVVYALAILLSLSNLSKATQSRWTFWIMAPVHAMRPNRRKIQFVAGALISFIALFAVCYAFEGDEFVYNTYIYHLGRRDHRHNFSIWFYSLYLGHNGTFAFFPQVAALYAISVNRFEHIDVCLMALTLAFVLFNKVVTAQYFLWWVAYLPLAIAQLKVSWKIWTTLGLIWFATELHWLSWAYQLEFMGRAVFLHLWFAGALFFLANLAILVTLLRSSCAVTNAYFDNENIQLAIPWTHKHVKIT